MNISEVSKTTGISQETLRYYEKIEILPKISRSKGGIRQYKRSDLEWIRFIKEMRIVGVSIDSLKEYLQYCNDNQGEKCKILLEIQKKELEKKNYQITKALLLLSEIIEQHN